MSDYPLTPPPDYEVQTHCEGEQSWTITNPQFPGTMHRIKSEFVNDPSKGAMLPSPLVRQYMADVAKAVEEIVDWGRGGP